MLRGMNNIKPKNVEPENLGENPEISVVIPVHNRSELLAQALKSLQYQTFQNWEAIVVDDHSTEDIAKVVSDFEDPRIKYFSNPGKKGIGASRNFGNRQALAPLIAVADSDDISLPRRLELSVKHFQEHPETDLFYGNLYIIEDGTYNIRPYKYFAPFNREKLYEGQFIPHATSTYKKDIILEFPYNEELPYTVDYEMLLTLADHDRCFNYTEEALYLWRFHKEERVSNRKSIDKAGGVFIDVKDRHLQYKLKSKVTGVKDANAK